MVQKKRDDLLDCPCCGRKPIACSYHNSASVFCKCGMSVNCNHDYNIDNPHAKNGVDKCVAIWNRRI